MAPSQLRVRVRCAAVELQQCLVHADHAGGRFHVAEIGLDAADGYRRAAHRGRKPALAACLCGTAVCLVLFGLSRSLWWAFGTRFLGGLFSGVGGTKFLIGECGWAWFCCNNVDYLDLELMQLNVSSRHGETGEGVKINVDAVTQV